MGNAVIEKPVSDTRHSWQHRLTRYWMPVVLVIASFAMTGVVTLNHSHAMSPVDEWVYLDYLYKFPDQGVIRGGEEVGPEARELMSCEGVRPYGPMGPECGGDYDDDAAYPYQGVTSGSGYAPSYFAITWAVGTAIHAVTGFHLVDSWRLTGGLWLAATMLMFSWLLRRYRVADMATLALGLAFIASPYSWWTYTYVSTDAPSAAFSVLLLIAAYKFLRHEWSGWWLILIGAVAQTFKPTNFLSAALVALFIGITWFWDLRKTDWQGLRTKRPSEPEQSSLSLPAFAIGLMAAVAAVQVGWIVLQRVLSIGDIPDQGVHVRFGFTQLRDLAAQFLPGTINSNVAIAGSANVGYNIQEAYIAPLAWICIAGVVGAFWTMRRGASTGPLIVATAIASVTFAPLLAVSLYVLTGSYFPLPSRYGGTIVLAFLLAAGLIMRNRWATYITLGYSSLLLVYVLLRAPFYA